MALIAPLHDSAGLVLAQNSVGGVVLAPGPAQFTLTTYAPSLAIGAGAAGLGMALHDASGLVLFQQSAAAGGGGGTPGGRIPAIVAGINQLIGW